MTDDSYFCTRLNRLCALERNIFYERSILKKQVLLKIIERIGHTKSIQPSKEVRIVGHSIVDLNPLDRTTHTRQYHSKEGRGSNKHEFGV